MPDPFGAQKIRREDLKPGQNLCEFCTAKCCRYFALPLDPPTTFEEYEYIRWFLLHDRASVFREDDDWYLLVHTTCHHLRADNRCGIYETRPQICRDYSFENCEYEEDSVYDMYLETADQVWEYTEAVWQPNARCARSRKPELLPVLA